MKRCHYKTRAEFGRWKCEKCGSIFLTRALLYEHMHKENHMKGNLYNKNGTAWNKGLTKETSAILREQSERLKKRYKNGELRPSMLGRTFTDVQKQHCSEAARKSTHQRVCKKSVQYQKKDGSVVTLDSSYEVNVADILENNNIRWCRPKPLIWHDKDNRCHNYFPDFYLIDFDIYLDPKNEYCFKVQKEKIDIIRKTYSNVYFLHKNDIDFKFLMSLCHKGCGADF